MVCLVDALANNEPHSKNITQMENQVSLGAIVAKTRLKTFSQFQEINRRERRKTCFPKVFQNTLGLRQEDNSRASNE